MGSGSNGYLLVAFTLPTAATSPVISYNSVSMTQLVKNTDTASGQFQYIYGLANPSTGSNTVSIGWTGSAGDNVRYTTVASYLGVSSTIDSSSQTTFTNRTTVTLTQTTAVDNDWLVGMGINFDNVMTTAGANTTIRQGGGSSFTNVWMDSGAALTPTGSYSISANNAGNDRSWGTSVALSPAAAAAATVITSTLSTLRAG